jgi:hypothetical protein
MSVISASQFWSVPHAAEVFALTWIKKDRQIVTATWTGREELTETEIEGPSGSPSVGVPTRLERYKLQPRPGPSRRFGVRRRANAQVL